MNFRPGTRVNIDPHPPITHSSSEYWRLIIGQTYTILEIDGDWCEAKINTSKTTYLNKDIWVPIVKLNPAANFSFFPEVDENNRIDSFQRKARDAIFDYICNTTPKPSLSKEDLYEKIYGSD